MIVQEVKTRINDAMLQRTRPAPIDRSPAMHGLQDVARQRFREADSSPDCVRLN
jgi:hypothetical protein